MSVCEGIGEKIRKEEVGDVYRSGWVCEMLEESDIVEWRWTNAEEEGVEEWIDTLIINTGMM